MPDNKIKINIDSLKINIDFQKLLHGIINIDQISVTHPIISMDNTINKNQVILPADFSVAKCIQGLKKLFDFLPVSQDSFEFIFNNASSPYFGNMDGSVYLTKKEEIILNTTINNVALSPSLIRNVSLEKYFNLGSIEFNQIKIQVKFGSNNEIHGRCSFIEPKLKSKNNKLVFGSNLIDSSFKLSDDDYKIDIKPFKSNFPKGSVEIHFENNRVKKNSSFLV
ncbi:MAG: hypothetical protein GXP56_02475, partial [Deltaproteobacteria bacterium]|nr:hypothetical protein [Deltaproteobacteria bacterium]